MEFPNSFGCQPSPNLISERLEKPKNDIVRIDAKNFAGLFSQADICDLPMNTIVKIYGLNAKLFSDLEHSLLQAASESSHLQKLRDLLDDMVVHIGKKIEAIIWSEDLFVATKRSLKPRGQYVRLYADSLVMIKAARLDLCTNPAYLFERMLDGGVNRVTLAAEQGLKFRLTPSEHKNLKQYYWKNDSSGNEPNDVFRDSAFRVIQSYAPAETEIFLQDRVRIELDAEEPFLELKNATPFDFCLFRHVDISYIIKKIAENGSIKLLPGQCLVLKLSRDECKRFLQERSLRSVEKIMYDNNELPLGYHVRFIPMARGSELKISFNVDSLVIREDSFGFVISLEKNIQFIEEFPKR